MGAVMMKPIRVFCRLAAAALLASSSIALAQQYPTKPVRIVVPFATGGSTAALAQLVAKELTDVWGMQVVVDPRPGGNTVIGTEHVAKQAPDGYTLLLASNSHVVIPQLITAPYDPLKDFTPVALLSSSELMLLVHPSVEANTLQEFLALARARPGQINYASAGSASTTHLAGELLATQAGVKIQHVPYKGSGPAISDLLGGHVQASFQTPIVCIPYVKSGKLKGIAVSGANRLPALPEVPTFSEAGLPGFNALTWFGIVVPAGTPKPIVDKVAQDLKKLLATAEFREKLATLGMDPMYLPADQFGEMMRSDMARYAKVIKTSNIKLE